MKTYTFEDYRKALIAGPSRWAEDILAHAAENKNLKPEDFIRLRQLAAFLDPA